VNRDWTPKLIKHARLPNSIESRTRTRLLEKLIKIGAKVVVHSRYVIFQKAEVAVSRNLFAAILERIQWFDVLPPPVKVG